MNNKILDTDDILSKETIINEPISKNQILSDMLNLQRKGIISKFKLDIDDIRRIIYNINTSPFSDINCCIWTGYITDNEKCNSKYINFYFKHHKIALHRLLYINYVNDLNNNNYLRFICKNKGICCNIKHIEKFNKKYSIPISPTIIQLQNHYIQDPNITNNNNNNNIDKNQNTHNYKERKFIIVFD